MAATLATHMGDFLSIEEAAQAVPCSVQTLHEWLQQGHLTGRDSFGRRDRQITSQSTGIMISVESFKQYCAKIGVKPDFGKP